MTSSITNQIAAMYQEYADKIGLDLTAIRSNFNVRVYKPITGETHLVLVKNTDNLKHPKVLLHRKIELK